MSVVVVGLEHTRAPLDLLEAVTVSDRDVAKVIGTLRGFGNLHEIVLLSTCLRTEVYAVVDRFHDAVDEITDVIGGLSGESSATLTPKLTIWYDHDVATHLFAVAAGLKSAVPGESEVLGQVKRAWERSREEQVTGPVLDELFRHALQAGKRVRTETGIARGTTSFAHAAAEQAARQLDGGFRGRKVCVVGTGEIGAGVLRALSELDPSASPASVVVVNRTEANARAAADAAGIEATFASLDELPSVLGDIEVCFTALDTERAAISVEMVAKRNEVPLLVVDLGLPRNCDPLVRDIGGVTIIDLNDLHLAVDAVKGEREIEATKAAGIVNDEVHGYRNAARARGAAPVVAALRTRLEALRATELERRRSEFGELSDQEWEKVDGLTRSILAKVLHEPTVVVKDAAGTPRGERLVEALRALFDL